MLLSPPNILTMIRILVIPGIVIAMIGWQTDWARWTALGLFVFAGVTDFFDGYIARRMGQVSNLGRFLDPVADKLLVATVIFMLVAQEDLTGIHILPGLIILVREITVSGLREFLAGLRVSVPVTGLAKWKTTVQMVALGFLIVGPASPDAVPTVQIGIVLVWTAALLTVITGFDYLRAGLRHMIEDTKPQSAE
ncbi:MAG: CDP-diacylglycerol--glycerol-3-phosphate 3-phosphatidyltransferase [Alphaproteobacteria bacterium]|nr:CDP-diacylglycerol--glycerol-3-phosphate 3-phosphatidyltransferase [Alphaproteobacteria bacterium]